MTANRAGADVVVLRWDDAILAVDPVMGGRLASLVVGGHELLVTEGDGPIYWGCYPMVPFAGRVRDGRFRFAGRRHQLPLTMPPNAIHGTVLDRPWHVMTRSDQHVELVTDLGPDWPFQGEVVQTVALVAGGLEASLELRAAEPMPVVLGWHPWFRRTIDGTAAALDFEARSQYLRGQDGLPTGATVPPTPRPWDDAFTVSRHTAALDLARYRSARASLGRALLGRLRRAPRRDLRRAPDRAAGCVQPGGGDRCRPAGSGARPAGLDRDGVALAGHRAEAGCDVGRRGVVGAGSGARQAFEATPDASGTFTPVTRFLPARLLVYIARSALIISSSAVPPSSG